MKKSQPTIRPTVAGLVITISKPSKLPSKALVAIHWPGKAKEQGEGNLTTVSGRWMEGESQENAMLRHVEEEYGLRPPATCVVTPIVHPDFVSPVVGKQYFWSLVEVCGDPGSVQPNGAEVASFGWYAAPDALATAVADMHASKAYMFKTVLELAAKVNPLLMPYHRAMQKRQLAHS
jgi:8-oxo-dGTP pyrophosphatase MutT (NUDIX family)